MLRFLPHIEENGFSEADAPKFLANPNRRHIFHGKTFIFLSEAKVCSYSVIYFMFNFQFQRFNFLLTLAQAKSVCVANSVSLSRPYFRDIFELASDPCLVFEAGVSTPEHETAYSVLRDEFNRRPILELEVALAIIEGTCEVYCNATTPYPASDDGRFLSFPADYTLWNMKASVSCNKSNYNPKRPR